MSQEAVIRRAVSYIRMSTDQQLHGHSLERQTKATKEYCEQNNLELVDSLQDIGLSGYSGKNRTKGQLGVFIEAMRNGEIEPNTVLIVENLDRLSRQDPLTALGQFSDMLNHGIELHTLFDRQVYTKESIGNNPGQLFLSIGQMMRAHDESQTKSKRLSSVWAKKRKDLLEGHKIITSRAPNWIKVIKDSSGKPKGFDLVESEAKVIRTIFDLSINMNMGSLAITGYLNKNIDKYPKTVSHKTNRAKGWGESYIKKVLNSPNVYGAFQPNKIINGKRVADGPLIKDYYPAVITEDEFLLNQSRMKQRLIEKKGREPEGHRNLFQGLLRCASCGSNLRFMNKGDGPKGGLYLQCSASRQSRAKCDAMSFRYEPYEEMFFRALNDVTFLTASESVEFRAKERDLELQLSRLSKEKEELEIGLNNLLDQLMVSTLTDNLKSRINKRMEETDQRLKEIETQISEVSKELRGIQDTGSPDGLVRDVRELLEGDLDDDELMEMRRSINLAIQKMISSIDVENGPLFKREDVKKGLVGIEDLNTDFLFWFEENKTDRWLYQDPVQMVGSIHGFRLHQAFITNSIVRFRSGEVRLLLPDGRVMVDQVDPESKLSLEAILKAELD